MFKQKHKTPKQRLSLHQSLNSFPHRKRREQRKFAVHAACTVLCWSSCTCPVLNTAAESHRFQTQPKTFSFTLMNSCWLNSSPFPKHSQITSNSKNVLLVHKLLQKHHAASRKNAKRSLWQKKKLVCWLLTNDMHIQEKIKLHHNRPNSLANAAHAASEFRKQRLTFLSINIITKITLHYHAKSRKQRKIHHSQMLFHHSAANPELCTKKTLL